MNSLAFGIDKSGEDVGLQSIQQSLDYEKSQKRKEAPVSIITPRKKRKKKRKGSQSCSSLTEQRYSGKDMHIPVDNRNGNP